jgi:hypothetical protein
MKINWDAFLEKVKSDLHMPFALLVFATISIFHSQAFNIGFGDSVDNTCMNQRRDKRVTTALRRRGWIVIRVKECDLRDAECTRKIVRKIEQLNVHPRKRLQPAA